MTWRLNITDDGQTAWLVSEKHSVELHTNGASLDYDLLREFAAWVNDRLVTERTWNDFLSTDLASR